MVQIGKYNTLEVLREVDFGIYLKGDNDEEILLPSRYVPHNCRLGDKINVFVYLDSEDRIIATTEHPYAQVGEFAYLQVKSTNRVGAFLDWGLMKDILVPFREQKMTMKEGYSYIVYLYVDNESQRIAASAKLDKYLDNVPINYIPNQEVDILVVQRTDLGYKVIIDNLHWGMVYHNEIFTNIERGDKLKGYIKQIRNDEKIDVSLQPFGYEKIDALSQQILDVLKDNDNYLPLTDNSPAETNYNYFSCSKKNFKKAIGALYRKHLILILNNGIKAIQ